MADAIRAGFWIGLLAVASVLFSGALACATPFAAFAAFAALWLGRRSGLLTVALVWAANQGVGFTVLHYPHTLACVGMGVALGGAGLAGLGAARWLMPLLADRGPLPRAGAALAAAFVAYEVVLVAVTIVADGADPYVTPSILVSLLCYNLLAFTALALIRGLAMLAPGNQNFFAALGARRKDLLAPL